MFCKIFIASVASVQEEYFKKATFVHHRHSCSWRQLEGRLLLPFRKAEEILHQQVSILWGFSPSPRITNVTFLQRFPVVSIFRLKKWRPWVYLREIMESCSDRRFTYFEWYRLQTAALGLKWKQEMVWPHLSPSQHFRKGTRTQEQRWLSLSSFLDFILFNNMII